MKNVLFSLLLLTTISSFAQNIDSFLFKNKKADAPQICKPIKQASKEKNTTEVNPCVFQPTTPASSAASAPATKQEKNTELVLP